jgi:hypothetical protein
MLICIVEPSKSFIVNNDGPVGLKRVWKKVK